MNTIVFILVDLAILYAVAGVCFLYFRYSGPETDSSMRHYLQSHHRFFASRPVGFWGQPLVSQRNATRKMIKRAGLQGWIFIALSLFNHWEDMIGYWGWLLSIALLFFGGLFFAYAWYGLRCLRVLGLDANAESAG